MTNGEYWDRIADSWSAGRDRLWRDHSDALNVALCRRWLAGQRSRRLLKTDLFDEAAGTGLCADLTGLSDRVHAIDLSVTIARRARTERTLTALAADVRHLPFPDAAFDAIVSNSTLDHFEGVEAIADGLRELQRVLAPDGRLLLTLDNGANPVVAVRNALPPEWLAKTGLVPYQIGRTLTLESGCRMLAELGFEVVEYTAIMHAPRVLAVPLARFLDRRPTATALRRRFLRALEWFEIAERWPTRFRTGHFVAFLARKP